MVRIMRLIFCTRNLARRIEPSNKSMHGTALRVASAERELSEFSVFRAERGPTRALLGIV